MGLHRMLIAGELLDGNDVMEVVNPATGKVLATAPCCSDEQFDLCVETAGRAFESWSVTALAERRKALIRIANETEKNIEELARCLVLEQGKPLVAARAEISRVSFYFRYFSDAEIPIEKICSADFRVVTTRAPLGVVGVIVPWNFPMVLMANKVAAALLTGNTVIVKPAPTTPLTTLIWGSIIARLIPAGVVNIVSGGDELGRSMSSHLGIRKIAFTGSIEAGRKVMAAAAPTLKRLTLELGGNDPAIVLGDVDPEIVGPSIFAAGFANNGQLCMAVKRVYVHSRIYESMCVVLARLANRAIVGNGLEEGVELGPVQNKAQFERVLELIEGARADGKIIAGGTTLPGEGYFIRPTIVKDVTDGMRIVDEEQFGPILPIIRFDDVEQVIRRVNDSQFGLGASLWTADLQYAEYLASGIEAGTVWINTHLQAFPDVPLSGAKQSGIGCEMGIEGLLEYTQIRVVVRAIG